MGKLKCLCGEVLSNSAVPNDTEGRIASEFELEDLVEPGGQDIVIDGLRAVWECHRCGRLAFNYPAKEAATVKWYRPEDNEPGYLLRRVK